MANRPGGELASRPLQFVWVVDCSGSMEGQKIASLNNALREALPEMQRVANDNPNAQVLVRVLKFSTGAQWLVSTPTPVGEFKWNDLSAERGAVTDMGRAMELLAEALKMEAMPARGLPPVLVLVSDGQPTDDFGSGLKKLFEQPWGKKAVRVAIGIGEDADMDELQKFVNHPELKALRAADAPSLVKYIRWASTVPLKAASQPASQVPPSPAGTGAVGGAGGPPALPTDPAAGNVPIPAPPGPVDPSQVSAADVF